MNSIESREFVSYRTDQLSAAAFQAAEHEPPKEVEREHEPVHWCRFCEENECMPNAHVCLECFNGPAEE